MVASRAAKEVDSFDGCQALSESVEDSSYRWRTFPTPPSFGADSLERLFDLLRQSRVGLLPRSPELLDESVVGPGIGRTTDKHLSIAARGLNLGGEPFQVFARVRCVGEHIH